MASRITGITIEINGDTKKLTEALKDVDRSLNTTQADLKDINKLLKLDPKNTELLKQKQDLLAKAIQDTESKLQTEKTALEQLKNADKSPEVEKQMRDLERQIIDDEQALKGLTQEAQDFGTKGKKSAEEVQAAFKNVGDKVSSIGSGMVDVGRNLTTYVTTPIVGGFTMAIKTASDYETSMAKVDAITKKAGESAEEHAANMEMIDASVRELAQSTKFTAGETADAAYYMAMAGWDVQEIYSGLPGVLNLAAASGEDLATTSDIVTDAMSAFGLEADEAGRFADVLAATSANANTNVGLLGESFKYVAPVAGQMNYSIEDVGLALGLMANNGVKGSMAGTTLRNVIQRLTDPTKKSAEAMEYLGLTEQDVANMSLDDILRKLRQEFKDIKSPTATFTKQMSQLDKQLEDGEISLDEYETAMNGLIDAEYDGAKAERVRYAAMLAGARGMPGFLAIIGTAEEDYDALSESIYNSKDAAQTMADTMQDTLAGQIQILISQLQELAIQVGEIVMPVLRDIVTGLQNWVKKLQQLDPKQKEMILRIAKIAAIAGPLIMIIGSLGQGIGNIIRILPQLGSAISTVVSVAGKAISGLASLLASNPYVILIAAIVAAVAALTYVIVKNWDTIKAKFKEGYDALKKKTGEFITNEVKNWKKFGEMIAKTATTAGNNLKTNITRVMTAISTGVTNQWNNIKTKVTTAIANIRNSVTSGWNSIKTTISTVSSNIANVAKERWTLIKQQVTTLNSSIKSGVASAWNSIANTVRNKMFSLKDNAISVFTNIKNTVTSVANKIRDAFRFKWELPKIKLPHFKVDEDAGISVFGLKIPKVRVEWYKKAYENPYLFTNPTVVNGKGFGDGSGGEIVYGREALMRDIAAASQGDITINVYASEGMNVNQLADKIQHRLVQLQRQRMAVYA